jgi:hypothetical protein
VPNPILTRIVAVLAAFFVTWLLDSLGIEMAEDEKQRVTGWLTTSLSTMGLVAWSLVYSVGHKLLERWLADKEQQAQRTGTARFKVGADNSVVFDGHTPRNDFPGLEHKEK